MCKDLLIGPEGSTAEKQELLTIIGDMLNRSNTRLFQALADMRGICHNLMPRTLQDYGLIRAVKDLCKQTEQSAGVHFEINIQRRFPDLKKTVEIDIYRIVQEFINNATRHGQAMRMICHFGKTHQGSVVIRLRDDGRGFLIGTEKVGMGLENISSRVRSHGGTFSVMSQPGRGAEYRVDLPAGVIENRKV
jgi:signal transduction histidine kinase